ncbi:hypothetical protein ACQYRI_20950 [Salmonella enterica]
MELHKIGNWVSGLFQSKIENEAEPEKAMSKMQVVKAEKKIHPDTAEEIAEAGYEILTSLNRIKNSAYKKDEKVRIIFDDTSLTTKILIVSAERCDSEEVEKRAKELNECMDSLFSCVGNPFIKEHIEHAQKKREYINEKVSNDDSKEK